MNEESVWADYWRLREERESYERFWLDKDPGRKDWYEYIKTVEYETCPLDA